MSEADFESQQQRLREAEAKKKEYLTPKPSPTPTSKETEPSHNKEELLKEYEQNLAELTATVNDLSNDLQTFEKELADVKGDVSQFMVQQLKQGEERLALVRRAVTALEKEM